MYGNPKNGLPFWSIEYSFETFLFYLISLKTDLAGNPRLLAESADENKRKKASKEKEIYNTVTTIYYIFVFLKLLRLLLTVSWMQKSIQHIQIFFLAV